MNTMMACENLVYLTLFSVAWIIVNIVLFSVAQTIISYDGIFYDDIFCIKKKKEKKLMQF